jgi:Tol biopolymer transport system component/DNA-binding winged helix-turn-helix (wHTH) protein
MASKPLVFRFADVEVREREFSLIKAGEALPVEPKAFRVLLILLQNPQRLITKDELLNAVWGDTAVSENSLARSIALLRRLLGDDMRTPRYIETVATVGYRFVCKVEVSENSSGNVSGVGGPNGPRGGDVGDVVVANRNEGALRAVAEPETQIQRVTQGEAVPAEAPGGGMRTFRWRWLPVAAIVAVGLATAVWYLRRPVPPPRISDYVRITHDGRPKYLAGTDGSRLYFDFKRSGDPQPIAQIAIAGGEIAPFPVSLPSPGLLDVSPDGSSFLVSSEENGQQSLWDLQIPGGSVRRMANGVIYSAAWSPDGRSVVYSTPDNDIFMVRSDGTDLRKLVAAEDRSREFPRGLAWSPDGAIIRFTGGNRLWEVSSDGSGLHQVLQGWRPSSQLCCSRWTPDGKFFLFVVRDNLYDFGSRPSQLWALDERRTLARQTASEPVQLTSGPIGWSTPMPGRDGKKIFASGVIFRGEMIRYDAPTRELKPWLGGISAEYLSYSPDGKSIVYVSFPEGILWRANRDGTNPVQLTSPPFYPTNPRWSPDGSKILFCNQGGGILQSYIMSSLGGTPQPILPDDRGRQSDPNWSPDGQKIIFASGRRRYSSDVVLRILDLASHQIVSLPGSQGIWSPRWSPNGRLIAGINQSGGCSVFDFDSQQWSELQKGECDCPTFSSNSQFVYFISGTLDGVYRVGVSGGRAERVVDLKGFHHTGAVGLWMGLDPTDTPMLLRDRGSDDIYALTLEEK